MFGWWKNRQRRKLVSKPFPPGWREMLYANFAQYEWLTAEEQQRLHDAVRIFIAERWWEGCSGLVLTEEMQVTIAGQACMLLLGHPGVYLGQPQTVLVYPAEYLAKERKPVGGGAAVESESARYGEAWQGGPMILSWPAVLHGGQNPYDGENLVYHEFAHVLDMLDFSADGSPPLSGDLAGSWEEIFSREHKSLIESLRQHEPTLLGSYAATNRAEFFAVSTERFFEQPHDLRFMHPDLYYALQQFYRQDPVSRQL